MVTKLKIRELVNALLLIESKGFSLVNLEEKQYNTLKITPVQQEIKKIEAA